MGRVLASSCSAGNGEDLGVLAARFEREGTEERHVELLPLLDGLERRGGSDHPADTRPEPEGEGLLELGLVPDGLGQERAVRLPLLMDCQEFGHRGTQHLRVHVNLLW